MMFHDERAMKAQRLGFDVVVDEVAKPLGAVELAAATARRGAAEQSEPHGAGLSSLSVRGYALRCHAPNATVVVMEFGWYHEFHRQVDQQSDADAFAQALEQVADAERWGLDAIWLAEIHQQAARSVLSAPLTVASAIAASHQPHQDRHRPCRCCRCAIRCGWPRRPPPSTRSAAAGCCWVPDAAAIRGPMPPTACPIRRAASVSTKHWISSSSPGPSRAFPMRASFTASTRRAQCRGHISSRTHRSASPAPARTPSRCSAHSAIRCSSRCAAARCRHWRRT